MCQVSALKIHRKCRTPDDPLVIYIVTENGEVGLCDKCWAKFAETDLELGKDPKPTLEEIFGRRAKEEAEATVTEYKIKGEKITEPEKEEEDF